MKLNQVKILLGAFFLTPLVAGFQTASAQAVPGGTLDPHTIPKYVTPLVIPPVLYDDSGVAMSVEVALRQINQQVLPAGFPTTPLWAYGNPVDPATFHNPSFTFEVTKDVGTTVTWKNELVDATGGFLPHIIKDQDGDPIVDQTLQWAAPNQDCMDGIPRPDCRGASALPYTGPIPMVVHVNGAHVGPTSAGYPEAWWLPAANNIPAGYATQGTFYDTTAPAAPGSAVYSYTNDQPTAALWYHDLSDGMTRLNTYASGAGFWMIRDATDGETGIITGTLPGPAPKIGEDPNGDPAVRAAIREIPIVIQPKSFNADGTQFYPANRAFFEGLGTGGIFADNTGVNIPFLPQSSSDIAPVWNPEAFFNTMVVNGNTWPMLEVAPERYRLRIVNAADSRFMNLTLHLVNGQGDKMREIPFYVIGSEQGLLPAVVRIETGYATVLPGDGSDVDPKWSACIKKNGKAVKDCVPREPGTFDEQALLMAPGERSDVIVDFSGFENGDQIIMFNDAPDAPFGGFPDVPADPATSGQVMKLVINTALSNPAGDPSTLASMLQLDPNPGGVAKFGAPGVTRDLALLEEESHLLCVTIDVVTGVITHDDNSTPPDCDWTLGSFPFAPKATFLGVNGSAGGITQLWDDPISENPAEGSIETWELWNWSADAHAIHLHSVKFEVLGRQIISSTTPSSPEPWETGWKDTVIAYPGEVTRIKARFDLPGLFSWHSNISSHQDNEMRRPYCVGTLGVNCPAELF